MSTSTLLASLGLLFVLMPLHASADVAVILSKPEHFTDIGEGYGDIRRNTAALEQHLKTQGAQCLRAGEKLELQVFNVDLAGRDEWWYRPGHDLRVMRDITWPKIDLGYAWRDAGGNVISAGREWVKDMNYLLHSATVRHDRDPLPYEKAMLHEW
ncbi:MAG: DUF3016 domain-containing protein, partial [Spongiibacteraceae bacterium]